MYVPAEHILRMAYVEQLVEALIAPVGRMAIEGQGTRDKGQETRDKRQGARESTADAVDGGGHKNVGADLRVRPLYQ